jgi:hypothetical protein
MSYCLRCGAGRGQSHMSICPDSSNPSEFVIADAAPEAPPRRRLSPIASGTQGALERIAELRVEIDENTAAEAASDASVDALSGDRSSGGEEAVIGPVSASDDVGESTHAI